MRVPLLFFITVAGFSFGENLLGVAEPSSFRKYIYSESLTEELLSSSDQGVTSIPPDIENYNLLISDSDWFTFEYARNDGRFLQGLELSYEGLPGIEFKQINILTYEPENPIINHGLYINRSGIYSFGLFILGSFSDIYERGGKIMAANGLYLRDLEIISLLESRNSYIDPDFDFQSSGMRSRTYLNLFPNRLVSLSYINDLDYNIYDEDFLRSNKLTVNLNLPWSEITLNGEINDKSKREFKYGIELSNNFYNITSESDFSIRYINSNLYYFNQKLSAEFFDGKLEISGKYSFEFELEVIQLLTLSVDFDKPWWNFNLEFTMPIDSNDNMELIASIYNKSY